MQALQNTGRIFYALGFAGLGLFSIIYGDFIVGRPPESSWSVYLNPVLGYVTGALLIICALIILSGKAVTVAALAISLMILIFSLPRHLIQFRTDWLNGLKGVALLGGTLIIAYSFSKSKRPSWLLVTGCVFLASFFIAGGYSHFVYAPFVKEFIPSYIPIRAFFTYFCGVCLIAGGIGILIPQTRKWAALLSAIMLTGWFLLLHIPRFVADTSNKSDRLGLCESLSFAGICFCLAFVANYSKGVKFSVLGAKF